MKLSTTSLCLAALVALPAFAFTNQGRGNQGGQSTPPTGGEEELQRQAKAAQERKQEELAATYFSIADYDGDGWISFREARTSLEIDRPRFLVYDADQDGQMTLAEYTLVSLETYRRYGAFKAPVPDPDDPNAASLLEALNAENEAEAETEAEYVPAEASTVAELFGRVTPRVRREHTAPEPDQLVGPVFPFRRLDYDNDGGIGRDDLDVLLLGAGLDARPAALIASLDLDGDQEISEAEFRIAMGDPIPSAEPAPKSTPAETASDESDAE